MTVSNPKPMHPGRVLASVFMADHGLNQTKLADKLGCTPAKINEIVNGKRAITADFALQLEGLFNLSASAWVRMQGEYDVWVARQKGKKKRTSARGKGGGSSGSGPMAAMGSQDE